eukprot:gene13560-19431_t
MQMYPNEEAFARAWLQDAKIGNFPCNRYADRALVLELGRDTTKKLRKILSDLEEEDDEIASHMEVTYDPDTCDSYRMKGILIGGVVVCYSKQQKLLLEDLNVMVRRVSDISTERYKPRTNATLKKGKSMARENDITMDAECDGAMDLGIVAADLNMQELNNLIGNWGTQQDFGTMAGEDELFEVPTLSLGVSPSSYGLGAKSSFPNGPTAQQRTLDVDVEMTDAPGGLKLDSLLAGMKRKDIRGQTWLNQNMPPMEEDEQFMPACPDDEDLLLVAHSEDFSAGQ